MQDLVIAAFNAYENENVLAPFARLFDPVDQVAALYPPLRDYQFYALAYQAGPRQCNCAESVLALVLAKDWQDSGAQGGPPVLEALAPNGLTQMAMIRRLTRMRKPDWPVYEYTVAVDRFTLLTGKPRSDGLAIVFLPAEPRLPVAHWTFGHVEHVDEEQWEAIRQRLQNPTIVFSRFVVRDPMVFWRAEVRPENINEFVVARDAGQACDCDWTIQCHHEWVYKRANPNWQSVTLDGERHVLGTLHGSIRKSLSGRHRLIRGDENAITQQTERGCKITRKHMYPNAAIKYRSRTSFFRQFLSTSAYVPTVPRGTWALGDFLVELIEFEDTLDLERINLKNVFVLPVLEAYTGNRPHEVVDLEYDLPDMAWGALEDLNLRLPRKDELLSRLACRAELTEQSVLDTLRRMAAEERWDIDVTRDEIQVWVKRLITEKGKHTVPRPGPSTGECWTCMRKIKTYRHMCRDCKHRSRLFQPDRLYVRDYCAKYVGFRPIWSRKFTLPAFRLKADVEISDRYLKKVYLGPHNATMTLGRFIKKLQGEENEPSCRGYLRGPMFLNQEPGCFPMGTAVAVQAFLVRLGSERVHQASDAFYDRMFDWLVKQDYLEVLEPESWEQFIDHFSGDKKLKMEEAQEDDNQGWRPPLLDGRVKIKMKGFPKAEKSYNYTYEPEHFLQDKPTQKPRFICCPNPLILKVLGKWTHAQTKWLAKAFNWEEPLFYAGCSTPEELNKWLNKIVEDVEDGYTLVDDISAMDSNHSRQSFNFHRKVRGRQFPHISIWIEAAYTGEERLMIRVGSYTCCVGSVNASGVSDTSYKNSLPCLTIRLFAVLHALVDINTLTDEQLAELIKLLLAQARFAASGDDGLVRLPAKPLGIDMSQFSLARYREAWGWAGFEIKVQIVPPNRWRMATFLAMRPVWAGQRYEWAPEPARRMRGMFWQIDNFMHPVVWVRGIATQVLQQARALPVLSDVCQWVLDRTTGPTGDVAASHVYSPFWGSKMSGGVNERSIEEFCLDYHVRRTDIEAFQSLLATSQGILVNLDCYVLDRIFLEES